MPAPTAAPKLTVLPMTVRRASCGSGSPGRPATEREVGAEALAVTGAELVCQTLGTLAGGWAEPVEQAPAALEVIAQRRVVQRAQEALVAFGELVGRPCPRCGHGVLEDRGDPGLGGDPPPWTGSPPAM